MAAINSYSLLINGHNLTAFAVMPLKNGDYLDESLDECYISLRGCPFKVFKPLLPVQITITNTLYTQSGAYKTHTVTKQYLLADTSEGEEYPVGSGRYNHTLYCIEPTKYLECIVMDSVTFTNEKGIVYNVDGAANGYDDTEDETDDS